MKSMWGIYREIVGNNKKKDNLLFEGDPKVTANSYNENLLNVLNLLQNQTQLPFVCDFA